MMDWDELDDRHEALFKMLERGAKKEKDGVAGYLVKKLGEHGLDRNDPRLGKEIKKVEALEAPLTAKSLKDIFGVKLRQVHKFVDG